LYLVQASPGFYISFAFIKKKKKYSKHRLWTLVNA